jgi:inhibitor of cysteine peptidase
MSVLEVTSLCEVYAVKKFLLLGIVLLLIGACAPQADAPPDTGGGTSGEMTEGAAYVESADVLVMESYPVQVAVVVEGSLPTPCHELRCTYEIQGFEDEPRLDIRVYSVADAEAVCIQMLEPFEARIGIPMQGAPDGVYVVYVNGERVGEFSYPA